MISDLKQTFNYSFFQEISDEWLFWVWDKEKTVFYFNLTPELLAHNINFFEDWPWYLEYYSEKLEKITEIWVVSDYEKLSPIWYKEWELEELLFSNRVYNFDYLCDSNCWVYHLEYNINKLNLLKEILYNTKKLKLNIKKQLLKTILHLLEKESINWSLDKWPKVFDLEVILDEIDLGNDLYIFNDIEILIYSLSINEDRLYIARLLNYLVNNLRWTDKETLIHSIWSDWNFYYIDSEKWEDYFWESNRDLWIRETFDWYVGNIWFKTKIKKNITLNKSLKVKYDLDKSILEYNWKKTNFSQWKWQKELIEKLYENLNNWLSEDEIWKKWAQIFQTLKDIKEKMVKQKWENNFSRLETKQLFQTFEDNKKKYFIMIW